MSQEGCLSGHYWHGLSICSLCGARLRCACGAYVREDNLDAHLDRCPVTLPTDSVPVRRDSSTLTQGDPVDR